MTNWTISSNGKYLLIESTDGNYWELEKNQITFKKANELVLIDRNGMHLVGIDYRRVNGGYGSTDLAIEALKAMVADAGITANIDTTVFTDGSQKTQIVDNAGDNIGTDANPIYVTSSTTTQGVATFQQQYNQTDLLNMILQELQEQTRILKKIYQ